MNFSVAVCNSQFFIKKILFLKSQPTQSTEWPLWTLLRGYARMASDNFGPFFTPAVPHFTTFFLGVTAILNKPFLLIEQVSAEWALNAMTTIQTVIYIWTEKSCSSYSPITISLVLIQVTQQKCQDFSYEVKDSISEVEWGPGQLTFVHIFHTCVSLCWAMTLALKAE